MLMMFMYLPLVCGNGDLQEHDSASDYGTWGKEEKLCTVNVRLNALSEDFWIAFKERFRACRCCRCTPRMHRVRPFILRIRVQHIL